MIVFLSRLDVELVSGTANAGRGAWRLTKPLRYVSPKYGNFTVPAGFVTDFASIPRLPGVFLIFGDTAHEAAALHDYLYATGKVPRDVADKIFLEAMRDTGVAWWRRILMYLGVRLFGESHYTKVDKKIDPTESPTRR